MKMNNLYAELNIKCAMKACDKRQNCFQGQENLLLKLVLLIVNINVIKKKEKQKRK